MRNNLAWRRPILTLRGTRNRVSVREQTKLACITWEKEALGSARLKPGGLTESL